MVIFCRSQDCAVWAIKFICALGEDVALRKTTYKPTNANAEINSQLCGISQYYPISKLQLRSTSY